MSTLSANNLSKSYRSRKVVKSVSLTVNSGEVVGFLGPNGAGKTTSFYMIVGLIPCDGGTICIDEHDISRLPIDKRSSLGLGYLPQEESIFRGLSVEDNILAILEVCAKHDEATRQSILDELLQEFHIGHLRGALGTSLSGGERRRVEIARSLASSPLFILLDEPFAGVDPISVNEIQGIITKLRQKNIGILLTEHNVRETLNICDRAYVIHEGEIIASGTPESILEDSKVRKVYLGEKFGL